MAGCDAGGLLAYVKGLDNGSASLVLDNQPSSRQIVDLDDLAKKALRGGDIPYSRASWQAGQAEYS